MTSLRGKYEVVRPLASGGMATVYLGVAHRGGGFERTVAIKVMHPGLAADPNIVAMFFDEARIAAQIRHVNVVSTLDVVEDEEGSLCLIMEYIDGHSLRDIMAAVREVGASIPVGVTLRILLDVLNGLHAAHELRHPDGSRMNLVHRDVSPHNILVSKDGVVKLADFGIVRAEQRLAWTRTGEVKGKLSYMAPEQLQGAPLDRRADLYAVGILLWELLTGERMFTGEHEVAIALAVAQGATRAPHEGNPRVPRALSEICMCALSMDRELRYATAAEFADALERAAEREGIRLAEPRGVASFCVEVSRRREVEAEVAEAPRSGSRGTGGATVGVERAAQQRGADLPTVRHGQARGLARAHGDDEERRQVAPAGAAPEAQPGSHEPSSGRHGWTSRTPPPRSARTASGAQSLDMAPAQGAERRGLAARVAGAAGVAVAAALALFSLTRSEASSGAGASAAVSGDTGSAVQSQPAPASAVDFDADAFGAPALAATASATPFATASATSSNTLPRPLRGGLRPVPLEGAKAGPRPPAPAERHAPSPYRPIDL